MNRSWSAGRGLAIAAVIVSSTMPVGPAGAALPGQLPQAATAMTMGPVATGGHRDGGRSVTLLTGDRVRLSGAGAVSVEPGEGRQGMRFLTDRLDGHVQIVPSDVVPLLAAGRLDQRLFDVTTLLEFGYDALGDLPLIVTSGSTARSSTRSARSAVSATRSAVSGDGVTVVRDLWAVNGVAVRATDAGRSGLWERLTGASGRTATDRTGAARQDGVDDLAAGVDKVWLDGLRRVSLDMSVPQIGAPAAWQAGYDGDGVRVAVLDSGVDAAHPDLAGQVGATANFTSEADGRDLYGHGTHVAATIAGTGRASNGRFTGVAPKAELLNGKICEADGWCAESWTLAGMQWAAEQGADVINMSLGTVDRPGLDPIEQAVDDLTARYGALFVISAGNDGRDRTINSPGSADAALTVGAVDRRDELAPRSSRGPRIDGGIKPEITAPGVDIVAANSGDGSLGVPGESYLTLSGTSMAAPHVAGAAAILAQRHPDASPAELKALLVGAAQPNPELGVFAQGAGRVDVARAVAQPIAADPPVINFGSQAWPPDDDIPVDQTVTYRNLGADPVTLALTALATGPDGRPAPAGMFSLGASRLTVPAGGVAAVTLTADTRIGGPSGYYTGAIGAVAGDIAVTTPFAAETGGETYDLTLRHVDQTGVGTGRFRSFLAPLDGGGEVVSVPYGGDGTTTVRLPKGRYAVESVIYTDTSRDGTRIQLVALLVHPEIVLTGDQTVVLDARVSKPLSMTMPRADASLYSVFMSGVISVQQNGTARELGYGLFSRGRESDNLSTAQLGPDRSYPWLRTQISPVFARLDANGSSYDSPYVYYLDWRVDSRIATGYTGRVEESELATVQVEYARNGELEGSKSAMPLSPEKDPGPNPWEVWLRLPSTRTEYYSTGSGTTWQAGLFNGVWNAAGRHFAELYGRPQRYEAGKRYVERWNGGVFGPSLADPTRARVIRAGNAMEVDVPMYSDGEHRSGYANHGAARVAVFRDGVRVAETAEGAIRARVPAEPGRYRVESETTVPAPAELSTRVSTTWTFDSGSVAGTEERRLPVSVVRFMPALSQENTAPAGVSITIPVVLQPQPGSAAAGLASLAVWVSYDDGASWESARVTRDDDSSYVTVEHPVSAGFVSLRAAAQDIAGNTVEQTVIRAYRVE